MSDIEALRLRVVEAAKAWADEIPKSTKYMKAEVIHLQDAVRALEVAERPDPWSLLREIVTLMHDPKTGKELIRAVSNCAEALVWYDKQQENK